MWITSLGGLWKVFHVACGGPGHVSRLCVDCLISDLWRAPLSDLIEGPLARPVHCIARSVKGPLLDLWRALLSDLLRPSCQTCRGPSGQICGGPSYQTYGGPSCQASRGPSYQTLTLSEPSSYTCEGLAWKAYTLKVFFFRPVKGPFSQPL
jgi:hypothetical protein